MGLEELKQKFILDEAGLKKNLEGLVNTALDYCFVDASGRVHLKDTTLPGKTRVKLALAAKAIANQLDSSFNAELTVEELAAATGLAPNQARARAAEAVDDRFAESPSRGMYRANAFRIAPFFSSLSRGESK